MAKIEKFENHLGSGRSDKHSVVGLLQRVQWSTKYKEEVKSLRARLAPNVATITVLLMTQTIDTLLHAESGHVQVAQELNRRLLSQSETLTDIERATSSVSIAQTKIEAGHLHLTTTITDQNRGLHTLNTKVDELLKDNIARDLQLHHQAAVLNDIQNATLAINSRNEESHILTAYMRQDTAEIKAVLPSILGRTLNLMKAVTAGISKIQDLAKLMSRMIKLTTRFTVEMRQTMQKLLQAFYDIQRYLVRLEHVMPKQIDLPIVRFRDAFNEVRIFPYDLCKQWQTFQGLVALTFTNRQGLHRVNLGQYFITNVRINRKLNPTFWSNAIEPSDELCMTMILNDIKAKDGFCPYKSCGASTQEVTASQGGKICPNCFRFAAISQKENSLSKNYHEQEFSVPEPDLEQLSEESVEFGKRQVGPTPMHSLPSEVLEIENIELYHSIQVAQALSGSAYEEDKIPEQKFLETSNDQPWLVDSNTSKFSFQIFVNTFRGKTIALQIHSYDTIATVRDMIRIRKNILHERPLLLFSGQLLEDKRIISDYGIQEGDTIYILPDDIYIYVKTFTGKRFKICAWPSENVAVVKEIISFEIGIPPAYQRLLFSGKELKNGAALYDYGITLYDTLHLLL